MEPDTVEALATAISDWLREVVDAELSAHVPVSPGAKVRVLKYCEPVVLLITGIAVQPVLGQVAAAAVRACHTRWRCRACRRRCSGRLR